MQCVQCWDEIKREDIRCSTCNELFCSQECLDSHHADIARDNEAMEFQDEYPSGDRYELANKYPWER